jgi:hypothetical protein
VEARAVEPGAADAVVRDLDLDRLGAAPTRTWTRSALECLPAFATASAIT